MTVFNANIFNNNVFNAGIVAYVSAAEAASLNDAIAALQAAIGQRTEAMVAYDTPASIMSALTGRTESATASDTRSAATAKQAAGAAEATGASTTTSVAAQNVSRVETSPLQEQGTGLQAASAAVTDGATPQDSSYGTNGQLADVDELTTTSDTSNSSAFIPANGMETADARDICVSLISTLTGAIENALGGDYHLAEIDTAVSIAEAVTLGSDVRSGLLTFSTATENAVQGDNSNGIVVLFGIPVSPTNGVTAAVVKVATVAPGAYTIKGITRVAMITDARLTT